MPIIIFIQFKNSLRSRTRTCKCIKNHRVFLRCYV